MQIPTEFNRLNSLAPYSVLEEASTLSHCFEDNSPLTNITFYQFGDKNTENTNTVLAWLPSSPPCDVYCL